MQTYARLCNAVYWLSLAVWISALISAAVAAMNVFPTLDRLPLALEQFSRYPVDEHPRLAAGMIMEGVFFVADLLQFIVIPLALIMLVLQLAVFRQSLRRPSNAVRAICIVVAAGLFAYHATMLAPGMNRELRLYWSAADAGQIDQARTHRAAFNRVHPTADAILRLNLILVLIAASASAIAHTPAVSTRTSDLERPKLLKPL